MSINRCELSGNVTRDSELKATPSGTAFLTFGLAFNKRKKDANGNWVDVPNFIECVVYGTRAQALESHIVKGTKLFVAGELRYSQWEKDGYKRSKIDLVVTDLDFASGNRDNKQQPQQQAAQPTYSVPEPAQPAYAAPELYDEDIPF